MHRIFVLDLVDSCIDAADGDQYLHVPSTLTRLVCQLMTYFSDMLSFWASRARTYTSDTRSFSVYCVVPVTVLVVDAREQQYLRRRRRRRRGVRRRCTILKSLN